MQYEPTLKPGLPELGILGRNGWELLVGIVGKLLFSVIITQFLMYINQGCQFRWLFTIYFIVLSHLKENVEFLPNS